MSARESLFSEAERQLGICNACRYCEGYCPVFPALARWRELDEAAITHLANLCHDCRDCYEACMYVEPHEFALNPPVVLSAVRRETYTAARSRLGRLLASPGGLAGTAALVAAVLVVLVGAEAGLGALARTTGHAASPYGVVSYPSLLVLGFASLGFALVVLARDGRRYWRATWAGGRARPAVRRVARALREALTLSQMRGGGAGCAYPGPALVGTRRVLHLVASNGLLLCLVSTIAAAVSQELVGTAPPYPYLSVPVVTGLVGGAGLVLGSCGLLLARRRARPETTDPPMSRADLGLLMSLALLGATGIATLAVRTTPAYGVVLVVHLTVVFGCFVLAPYSKFVHALYRTLALVIERLAAG